MMMVLSVLYEIPELNLGFHFYLKNDSNPDEEQTRLRGADPSDTTSAGSGHKYQKQVDDAEGQAARGVGSGGGTYQSFQDKDVGEGEE